MTHTREFSTWAVEPFPEVLFGADLAALIADRSAGRLVSDDILVVASKVVSLVEGRTVDLAGVVVSDEALRLSRATGKDRRTVQVVLDESVQYRLAGPTGPIIAYHRLGFELTSAGVDQAGPDSVFVIPEDPDASARRLRDSLRQLLGIDVAVVVADSDGRPDRAGSTVVAIGAAGIAPLRITETVAGGRTKQQEETLVDMVAAAAGVVIGQRGRGAPVAVISGVSYDTSDAGVRSILHRAPTDAGSSSSTDLSGARTHPPEGTPGPSAAFGARRG